MSRARKVLLAQPELTELMELMERMVPLVLKVKPDQPALTERTVPQVLKVQQV